MFNFIILTLFMFVIYIYIIVLNVSHQVVFARFAARQPHAGLVDATDVDSNDLFEVGNARSAQKTLLIQ